MNIDHGLNISQNEWYLLKDALLGASYHKGAGECKWYTDLPSHLKESDIGGLIHKALYKGDKDALNKAAKIMTGGSDIAWAALEKL
ncbi:MAG: hypothetical protein ACE37N_01100 [Pseudohongiellaceae bacterium]|jgi:hypothetical protein